MPNEPPTSSVTIYNPTIKKKSNKVDIFFEKYNSHKQKSNILEDNRKIFHPLKHGTIRDNSQEEVIAKQESIITVILIDLFCYR